MQKIKFSETVEAYPVNAKPGDKRVTYVAGEEYDVAEATAKLMIEKGHAKFVEEDAPAPTTKKKGGNVDAA